MIKQLFCFLAMGGIVFAAAMSLQAAITDIAVYPMGESGSVVSGRPQDTTGNGHHYNAGGQGITVQTSSPSPVSTTYIDLRGNPPSGVDGAYSGQYGTGMPADNFVVEMWARTSDDNGHIWASNHNTTTGSLRFEALSNNWAAGITGVAWINTSHPVSADTWTHLAVIRENGTSRFYVDGQVQSGSATGAVTWTTSAALGLRNTTPRNYYTGDLDELRVYTFNPAADDPVAEFNLPETNLADGLMGYWDFEEGGGNTAGDGGFGDVDDTATLGAGPNDPAWTTGKVGSYALDFDGDDYARANWSQDVGRQASPNNITDAMSVQAWVKFDTTGSTMVMVDKRRADNLNAWTISAQTSGAYTFWFRQDPGWQSAATPGGTQALGQWTHLVATYEKGDYLRLYVDGEPYLSSTTMSLDAEFLDDFLRFGESKDAAAYLDGQLDEVAIWNRELSSFEVSMLYNNGAGIAIPEPSALCLTALGLLGLLGWRRRRRRTKD